MLWWLVQIYLNWIMKIVFFGQRCLPKLLERDKASAARRTEALAMHWASLGHEVTVYGNKGRVSRGDYHGVETVPARWPRTDADVYHMHGWRGVLAGVWLRFWRQDVTLVWTIDALTQTPPCPPCQGGLLRFVAAHFDSITVPTRLLQYRLLNEYGLYSRFVPDGYYPPLLQDAPLKKFKLKKEQYCLALFDTPEELEEIAQAYALAKKRKKLVILQDNAGVYRKLKRKYKFLRCAGGLMGRSAAAVARSAATVIVNGQGAPLGLLLQAMDGGRAIIVSNHSVNQEVIGTAGRFFRAGDTEGLAKTLKLMTSNRREQKRWGKKAAIRAKHHLRWQRVLPEYEMAYQAMKRPVPMDSAVLAGTCKVTEIG